MNDSLAECIAEEFNDDFEIGNYRPLLIIYVTNFFKYFIPGLLVFILQSDFIFQKIMQKWYLKNQVPVPRTMLPILQR